MKYIDDKTLKDYAALVEPAMFKNLVVKGTILFGLFGIGIYTLLMTGT